MTLRDVEAGSLHDVAAAVEAVREDGFINYFGLQRFGSAGGRTHRCPSLITTSICLYNNVCVSRGQRICNAKYVGGNISGVSVVASHQICMGAHWQAQDSCCTAICICCIAARCLRTLCIDVISVRDYPQDE